MLLTCTEATRGGSVISTKKIKIWGEIDEDQIIESNEF